MSLEKSIQKLTNAITAAKMAPSVNVDPFIDPSIEPIRNPPLKVVCKTEWEGMWPNVTAKCVCRFGKDCIVESMSGPCAIENFRTTVPMGTPCQ